MKKTIEFGKIEYFNPKKKANLVTVEIELKEVKDSVVRCYDTLQEVKEGLVFSASASVWNSTKSDIYMGGQYLDTLIKYLPTNKKFRRIFEIWKMYHLNDLKAGTKLQTEALNQWRQENNIKGWAYDQECEYLKSIGLYNDRGYMYGTGWLFQTIPSDVIEEIKTTN
jgi:hypothetical protein